MTKENTSTDKYADLPNQIDNEPCNEERRNFLKTILGMTIAINTNLISLFDVPEAGAEDRLKSNKELVYQLFNKPELTMPAGQYNAQQINKWRNRYNGKDKKYITNDLKFKIQHGWPAIPIDQELREGFLRMVKTGDLKMIYDKCLQYKVPFEVVFLALGESHWKDRNSKFASGHWQFIPSTARYYGLIESDPITSNYIDHRNNPKKSTNAAMELLNDNFQRTYYWDEKFNFSSAIIKKISDQDRWFYAMWQYNMSPAKVAKKYALLQGQSEPYAQNQENRESQAYVNKMMGIKLALQDQTRFLLSSIGETAINSFANITITNPDDQTNRKEILHIRSKSVKPDNISRNIKKAVAQVLNSKKAKY